MLMQSAKKDDDNLFIYYLDKEKEVKIVHNDTKIIQSVEFEDGSIIEPTENNTSVYKVLKKGINKVKITLKTDKVGDYKYLFWYCDTLKKIPKGFFKESEYGYTYYDWAFCGDVLLEETPKYSNGKELWEGNGTIAGEGCFYNCKQLPNYNQIPSEWK